jgi:hypothetical protein
MIFVVAAEIVEKPDLAAFGALRVFRVVEIALVASFLVELMIERIFLD